MKKFYFFFLLGLIISNPVIIRSQSSEIKSPEKLKLSASVEAPVIYNEDTLFYLHRSLGSFSASERAAAITKRLESIVKDLSFSPDSIASSNSENVFYITYKDQVILAISPADTIGTNMPQAQLASETVKILQNELSTHNKSFNIRRIIKEILLSLLVILIFGAIVKTLNVLFARFLKFVEKKRDKLFKSLQFKNYEFLTKDRQYAISLAALRILKIALIVLTFLIALPVIFIIFPATEGITRKIVSMIWGPFKGILLSIANFLPNLISIGLIYFVTRYLIKFLKFLAGEIDRGQLVIPGFYSDWAKPTFKVISFILYAFMFVVIFPYLPGSDSPIFRGVSVFLGLLISLGSTSAVGNTVAGLVITYMRPFKIGDRIKIDDIVGEVVEKTLLVTRIRTIKNEDVTMPNAKILTGYTVNYSTPTDNVGLIIHTTVSIGYNAPWRKVHELLLNAAEKTKDVIKEPKPFVLQTSLDDFYISYQINAYIKNAQKIIQIKSDLHQNIQDAFNKAGIEIMSPHYRAERDGNNSTLAPVDPPGKEDKTTDTNE